MTKQWYEKQLRILQTVLREPDIVDYDAKSVVDYMKEIHANCLVINGGGIIDFFRHDLFSANPNSFMKKEDILHDITEACHKEGFKVVVRVDFRGVDKRIYELYPDLFAVDENGNPVFWGSPNIPNPVYAPCYQSYYRNEHAEKFISLLMEKYDVDAIWENAYSQDGICYCKTCQEKYRRDIGKELPMGDDFFDSHFDEYRTWKAIAVKEHLKSCRTIVKEYGEDKAFCAEIFGLFYDHYKTRSQDLFDIKDDFDFLVTPLFTANHEPLNAPSTLIKFLKSLEPKKTPVMLFGHLGTNNELRYVSSEPQETRIWLWQAISEGGSIWNTIFNGQHPNATYDRRNAWLVKDIYSYMEEQEDLLINQSPVSDISILYSRGTNNLFGNDNRAKDNYVTHLIGMEQVLTREKIQYTFLLDNQLTKDSLSNIKVLIMPNAACLSDDQIGLIQEFVKNGGKLLATYESSLYNEKGEQRSELGLSDVFGCTYTGIKKSGSQYGYQSVNQDNPLTNNLGETSLLANWGQNLLVRPLKNRNVKIPFTYVPQIFPQPPERSWLNSMETPYPSTIINSYGKGEVVYYPYEVDRNVWMHGHSDFSQLLKNGLNHLIGDERKVVTNSPESLQLTLNRIENTGYMLHGINLTASPTRPVREIISLHDIEVEIIIEAEELTEIIGLYGCENEKLAYTDEKIEDNKMRLKVKIPKINEYLSILIKTN